VSRPSRARDVQHPIDQGGEIASLDPQQLGASVVFYDHAHDDGLPPEQARQELLCRP
jgi:hypothetical protein